MSKTVTGLVYLTSLGISFVMVFAMNYQSFDYIEQSIGSSIGISLLIAIVPTVIYLILSPNTIDKKEKIVD